MIFIIGSGLSAIATAIGLVERGYCPTLLDAGLSPDIEALKLKRRLSATGPESWNESDLRRLRRTGPAAVNSIPRKLYFGSDFVFQEAQNASPLDVREASVARSFAAGGFSNVWGAAIQPMASRDMEQWPFGPEEMAPHYAAMQAMMIDPESGSSAGQSLPLAAPDLSLRPSAQARAFYADLSAASGSLRQQNIRFEYARLAVLPVDRDGRGGCRYCGQCIYGCPYGSIFTSSAVLDELIRARRIHYVAGVIVDKVTPDGGKIVIEGRSLNDGARRHYSGQTVFVAAGFLETARIILSSLGIYDTPLAVKHSDIFTLPLVRYRATDSLFEENLHTLCQLVFEIEDPAICPGYVRLQLYGYNDLYSRVVEQKMGLFAPLLQCVSRALVKRLFVVFGYLHSNSSSEITLTLTRESRIRVVGRANREAERICRAVSRKLIQNRVYLRAIPLPFQLKLDLPGGGYHSGGSFPMRRVPGALETDRWGSLGALPGVHIVDASVLPSVPASPLAFTVMANAHRIASGCEVLDVP